RFTHQADDLAGIDGEAHRLDGVGTVGAGRQRDGEVADFENRPPCGLSGHLPRLTGEGRGEGRQRGSRHTFLLIFGSSVSRSPSPMMLMAITVSARKMPG